MIRRNSGTDLDRIEAGKKWVDKKYTVTFVQPNGKQLGIIAQLIADGRIRVHVDDVIPFEKARFAPGFLGSAARTSRPRGVSRGSCLCCNVFLKKRSGLWCVPLCVMMCIIIGGNVVALQM